ncbi:MAG: PhnD/SsuA/transferrin family substrate-binding protein [Candidatus Accumulibacter sp.]|nr:PhnD/SsuA/transferrin family substrate-binding protein [Accumulibacter sp.]
MPNKFQFSVCPHDTAKNLLGWFTINTYLQRKLGVGIHFEPQDNFLVERQRVLDVGCHIVYANPYSAGCFVREKGYLPVARPVGVADETLVVARVGATLPAEPRVASATDKLIIHFLGLGLLPKLDIDASRIRCHFVGNHLNVAASVINEEADLGFIFNETWAGLAAPSRKQLQVLAESRGGHAFHCFMVGPDWADRRDAVQEILCHMHEDPSGRKVLADLHFTAFEPIGSEDLATMITFIDS